MKVYLDNSVLNRPFDDQIFPQIRLETEATFLIFKSIEQKQLKMINSSVVEYENSRNPFPERKDWINNYLKKAEGYQKMNARIQENAKKINALGIDPLDALHLATAEIVKADIFITCDEKILKRYKGQLKTYNPVDFVQSWAIK
ncbi:MAG: PIN domain-containing protein [bacterium]|nr:PIN domain-containing protein [bacterium]